jgi:hypothetical protein
MAGFGEVDDCAIKDGIALEDRPVTKKGQVNPQREAKRSQLLRQIEADKEAGVWKKLVRDDLADSRGRVYYIEKMTWDEIAIEKAKRAAGLYEPESAECKLPEAPRPERDLFGSDYKPGAESSRDAFVRKLSSVFRPKESLVRLKADVNLLGKNINVLDVGTLDIEVKGDKIGPYTVDEDGTIVAVDVGGRTVRRDGVVIGGGGGKRASYKYGVDAPETVIQGGQRSAEYVEANANPALGTMSADGMFPKKP